MRDTGLILADRDGRLYRKWFADVQAFSHMYHGENETLVVVADREGLPIGEVSDQMFQSCHLNVYPNPLVFHWIGGRGKYLLRERIARERL